MFKKRIVTMVGNEVVFANTIEINESNTYAIEKLTAVFNSSPTIMWTDDLEVIEGSTWNGKKFIPPVG